MLKCIVKNGLIFAQEIDPEIEVLDLKFMDTYMHQGFENYVILIKDEEHLRKLFPDCKEIARNDESFVIKE